MSAGNVVCRIAGWRAEIVFDRPAALNAMTWAMYDALTAFCDELAGSEAVRVVVLRGAGSRAFISGTDIGQFGDFDAERGLAYEARIETIIEGIERLPQATIALMRGTAAGGGLVIASACDLRIATPDVRFTMPIAYTVGNCLSVANLSRLAGMLGSARLKAMMFAGQPINAAEARTAGALLFVAEPDEIEMQLDALCDRLNQASPLTLQATKEGLRRIGSVPAEDADLIRLCYGSRQFTDRVRAFGQKAKTSMDAGAQAGTATVRGRE